MGWLLLEWPGSGGSDWQGSRFEVCYLSVRWWSGEAHHAGWECCSAMANRVWYLLLLDKRVIMDWDSEREKEKG